MINSRFQKFSKNVNGWGFVPIGAGNYSLTRTSSNHYFYGSEISLCGIVVLDDLMKHDYRFTKSKNLMKELLCASCKKAIAVRNRTVRQLKERGID